MIRNLALASTLIFLGSTWGIQAHAHSLTLSECTEGGEFIRNAALARDNGITREFFVNKLSEDLAMIQTYPRPALVRPGFRRRTIPQRGGIQGVRRADESRAARGFVRPCLPAWHGAAEGRKI